MENEKKVVQKVDFLDAKLAEVFNLTKNEALERLKSEKVSESEQMLNKWCRDGDIKAVRVSKGKVEERGLRISETSLEAFILSKTGRVEELIEELIRTKTDLKAARAEIKELKQAGIRKPRAKKNPVKEPILFGNELEFRMDRAKHKAFFEEDSLTKVERNTRTGFIDVTDKVTDEQKEFILEAKKKLKS